MPYQRDQPVDARAQVVEQQALVGFSVHAAVRRSLCRSLQCLLQGRQHGRDVLLAAH